MATEAFPPSGTSTVKGNTTQATFIPELWSDEVIAAYKKNLKFGNLVRKMPMVGKKGDTIHIPKPVRGVANQKAEATAVTIQANVADELIVNIDRHFEYSVLIEDITEKQALSSMRRFYTDDAGYALALQVDTDLGKLGTGLGNGGAYTLAPTAADWVHNAVWYNDGGATMTNFAEDTVVAADVFTDDAMRFLLQKLDEADVPMDQRCFVVPPSLKNTITGIERYVSNDFRDVRTVQNGLIGSVYGVDIYVTTNCPDVETSGENAAAGNIATKGAMLFHKDAFVFAEQMGVRSQTQYKQEYLSDLFTADTLYGLQVYRPENGVVFAAPQV